MAIYMDRHDVSEAVTAEIVAKIHQEDLKIQHKYGCRGLTYWFDDIRKTAFCLIDAPDINAIIEMHKDAHGEVPHQIIEVDATVVESFLGRIEDPEKAQNTDLNIINDPAFRTIMVVSIHYHSFHMLKLRSEYAKVKHKYYQMIEILKLFDGTIVKQNGEGILISFPIVTKAVDCALKIREGFESMEAKNQIDFTQLSIGLHAGVPVTEKKSIFEDTIKSAERMGNLIMGEIVVSTEVHQLYESENLDKILSRNQVYMLSREELKFIDRFMEFIEKEWQNTKLKVVDFEKHLGLSKSKLYREMIRLAGKPPNVFLQHYRLQKSLYPLKRHKGNISDVAYSSGFNSPSYYAKCFRKKYGIMPSEFLQP